MLIFCTFCFCVINTCSFVCYFFFMLFLCSFFVLFYLFEACHWVVDWRSSSFFMQALIDINYPLSTSHAIYLFTFVSRAFLHFNTLLLIVDSWKSLISTYGYNFWKSYVYFQSYSNVIKKLYMFFLLFLFLFNLLRLVLWPNISYILENILHAAEKNMFWNCTFRWNFLKLCTRPIYFIV